MAGYSLHIGLNSVDPRHYDDWDGKLKACENDMRAMTTLAQAAGFQSLGQLATRQATREAVLGELQEAARKTQAGDLFLVTYSGHGGQVPDPHEPGDHGDDETWCLFDGQLLDDELLLTWIGFAEGARILIVSDSCHSGGMEKFAFHGAGVEAVGNSEMTVRQPPVSVLQNTYYANKEFYDELQRRVRESSRNASEAELQSTMGASAILIAACQDFQLSYETKFGGLFTSALISVWDYGRFVGNYSNFRNEISQKLPHYQNPQTKVFGGRMNSFPFEKPFRI